MKGFMYILLCADGSYYTGSTTHLDLRLHQHQTGEGANHTKKHLPVKLIYYEEFDRIDDAFYREKQIQGWSRKKKETLIQNRAEDLPLLSRNYTQYGASTSSASEINNEATVPSIGSGTEAHDESMVPSKDSGTEANDESMVPSTGSGTEIDDEATVPSTGSGTEANDEATVPSTGSGTERNDDAAVPSTGSGTDFKTGKSSTAG